MGARSRQVTLASDVRGAVAARRAACARVALVIVLSPVAAGAADGVAAGARVAAREQLAIERGLAYLTTRIGDGGALRPAHARGVPALPLSAMGLWAFSRADPDGRLAVSRDAVAAYVIRHRQEDGGVYDPERGLVRFTAAVALEALRSWRGRSRGDSLDTPRDPSLDSTIDALALFAYRHRELESFRQESMRPASGVTARRVDELLARGDHPRDVARALEFLSATGRSPAEIDGLWRPLERAKPSSAVSYDDLLRALGGPASRDEPTTSRLARSIRAYYTLERNPDLTQRFGAQGFLDESAGLFFYYAALARTLHALRVVRLVTADGSAHDWASELGERLSSLQRDDGSWQNESAHWWEDDPALATCYALLALAACRDARVGR